jgi:hypothetical protein
MASTRRKAASRSRLCEVHAWWKWLFVALTPVLGGSSSGCQDKDKEQAIMAAIIVAEPVARVQTDPFRSALRAALMARPPATVGPCTIVPETNWEKEAELCNHYTCVGITFFPYEYQASPQPLERTMTPSRVDKVLGYQRPKRGLDDFYRMPDYEDILSEVRSWSTPAYWSYEVVVVDDGPAWPADASTSASSVQALTGRAFAYDYTSKTIQCGRLWRTDLPADGERRKASILAAVAALRGPR